MAEAGMGRSGRRRKGGGAELALTPELVAESARSAEPGEGSGAVLYDLVPHPLASRVGLSPEGRGGRAPSSRGLAGPRLSMSLLVLLAMRRERSA